VEPRVFYVANDLETVLNVSKEKAHELIVAGMLSATELNHRLEDMSVHCPGLYRIISSFKEIVDEEIEDEIREEFIVRAPIFSDYKPAGDDDWEWYFLMQHYGAPTRLLDWTEGALLALYFAVKDNPGHYDATVWALDPYKLNKRAIDTYEVIPPSAQGVAPRDRNSVKKWLPSRFKETLRKHRPVAVFPTHVARRISTQRSCFTVHGKDYFGLDRLEKSRDPILRKLVIPSFCVREIKEELIDCGIDEATIFPDLDGLGKAVGAEYAENTDPLPHSGVVTRLELSKAYPGRVGVSAISEIKKGQKPFRGENEEILWLEKKTIKKAHLSSPARKLYREFCLERGERLGCPINFNRLTVAWYLRHAKAGLAANVRPDRYYEFHALRNIKAGEELIADFIPD
jgi:FRG domain